MFFAVGVKNNNEKFLYSSFKMYLCGVIIQFIEIIIFFYININTKNHV